MPIIPNNELIYRGDRPAGTSPEEVQANNLNAAEVDGNFKYLENLIKGLSATVNEPFSSVLTFSNVLGQYRQSYTQAEDVTFTLGADNIPGSVIVQPFVSNGIHNIFLPDGYRSEFNSGEKLEAGSYDIYFSFEPGRIRVHFDKIGEVVAPPAPLSTPSLNASVISSTQINVTLGSVADASSYLLETSTNSTTWNILAVISGTFNHTGLTPETNYQYRGKAVGNGNTKMDSAFAIVNATTSAPGNFTPDAPQIVDFTDTETGGTFRVIAQSGIPFNEYRYIMPGNSTALVVPDNGIVIVENITGQVIVYSIAVEGRNQSPNAISPSFNTNYVYAYSTGVDQNITVENSQDFNFSVNEPFTVFLPIRLADNYDANAIYRMGVSTETERNWDISFYKHPSGVGIFDFSLHATNNDYLFCQGYGYDPILFQELALTYDGTGTQDGIKMYVNGSGIPKLHSEGGPLLSDLRTNGLFCIGKFATFESQQAYVKDICIAGKACSPVEVSEYWNNGGPVVIPQLSFFNDIIDAWTFRNTLNSVKGTHNGTPPINPVFIQF